MCVDPVFDVYTTSSLKHSEHEPWYAAVTFKVTGLLKPSPIAPSTTALQVLCFHEWK